MYSPTGGLNVCRASYTFGGTRLWYSDPDIVLAIFVFICVNARPNLVLGQSAFTAVFSKRFCESLSKIRFSRPTTVFSGPCRFGGLSWSYWL